MPSIYNGGPQGFSETLYAYTSQANNNGSAFAGYTGFVQPNGRQRRRVRRSRSPNLLGGVRDAARPLPADARRARRRRRARRQAGRRPPGPGTMRTDTPTFVVLLVGTVLLVALLTFVPALLLGPSCRA